MRVTYFVAASLDGFIAGPRERLDWLLTDDDYAFAPFFASVDALAMGRRTYDAIHGFGQWPYGETPSYVFTRRDTGGDRPVSAVSGDVRAFAERMAAEGVESLWLVGGGDLAAQFLSAGRLDAVVVSVHPVVLGSGTPLFGDRVPVTRLHLDDARAYASGLVQMRYRVVRDGEAGDAGPA